MSGVWDIVGGILGGYPRYGVPVTTTGALSAQVDARQANQTARQVQDEVGELKMRLERLTLVRQTPGANVEIPRRPVQPLARAFSKVVKRTMIRSVFSGERMPAKFPYMGLVTTS